MNAQVTTGRKADVVARCVARYIPGNMPHCPECDGGRLQYGRNGCTPTTALVALALCRLQLTYPCPRAASSRAALAPRSASPTSGGYNEAEATPGAGDYQPKGAAVVASVLAGGGYLLEFELSHEHGARVGEVVSFPARLATKSSV